MAVGALDGLILDSVLESVEPGILKGDNGPHVIKWVKENPERLLIALSSPQPAQVVVSLCRDQLITMTFQKSKMIEGILTGVAQCQYPWERAARSLSSPRQPWTQARVALRLDEFVLRRHAIAHSGDMTEARLTSRPIQLRYVEEAERVIRAVGLAVCDNVDDRIRALRRP